jgi:predicted transcriptional regulator
VTTEHEKAKAWREAHGLSLAELSPLIGYSTAALYWFEAGKTPPRTYKGKRSPSRKGRVINPTVWLRYKAACAGIDAWLKDKRRFDW